ncbi:type II toxin-antitoxin system VapC family toxin [Acidithiobacillus sp. M4-SHS-6]|uniref:type II toxin-antitoxin system VapC family toxin n=1 Tax=Acidithiobacillus sp. M4-SHS-6 TaxID=3383024 RepID=UPI0039BDA97C
MIAIDTNILVRLLTRDNEEQYEASHKLFSSKELFIPDTVILETEWVLRYAYELEPVEVCAALRGVFGLENVHLANAQTIALAISWHEQGLDFADAFHLSLCQGHEALKTFDEKFAKKAKALTDCRVEKP